MKLKKRMLEKFQNFFGHIVWAYELAMCVVYEKFVATPPFSDEKLPRAWQWKGPSINYVTIF